MFAMVGCKASPTQIGATVKDSMQQTFDKDPDFSKMHMHVDNVVAVKKTDTAYDGTASITYKGASHQVPVHITLNKDDVDWKTDPGSLDFDPPAPSTMEMTPEPAQAHQ
jgi:hypothetical protein